MSLSRIPVGKLEVEISCLMSPISPDIKSIPKNGMPLHPGEITWTNASHYPVIIATAREHMMVACGGEHVVTEVIASLRKLGATVDDIVIYMQFLPQTLESEYMDQAQLAGVRNVWATLPECQADKYSLILIERTS